MHFFQWLFLLGIVFFNNVYCADDFAPNVSMTVTHDSFLIQAFDDSTTLLLLEDSKLKISQDNGMTWGGIGDINEAVMWFRIDEFHKHNRAFVLPKDSPGIYITNDQGSSWSFIDFDISEKEEDEEFDHCEVASHPSNRDYILANCNTVKVLSGMPLIRQHFLVSDDGGKNFRPFNPPEGYTSEEGSQVVRQLQCSFGENSPKSSLFNNDPIIYCLERIRVYEQDNIHNTAQSVTNFWYSENLGDTFNTVEDLNDKNIVGFIITDKHMIITTVDDQFNYQSEVTLWVSSNAKAFDNAVLPTIVRHHQILAIYEDIAGRIIIPCLGNPRSEGDFASLLLRSDSTGLKFTILPWGSDDRAGAFTRLEISDTLPGTILGIFNGFTSGEKGKKMAPQRTKITTDNGVTWNNLRIVDPHRKNLYSCDIDDFENCFLVGYYYPSSIKVPTAGIIMMMGTESETDSKTHAEMKTFISTDGGQTWKIAFDFPTQSAFGDYGNIIVVVPFDPESDGDPKSEFYYSLDQGETWSEYQLETTFYPIELSPTTPDGSGLNFFINGLSSAGSKRMVNLIYAIDFSDAFDGKACQNNDFETWQLADGKCINGARHSMQRRKQDSSCLVRKVYEDLQTKKETCERCMEEDYECSFEFSDSDGTCVADYHLLALSGACSEAKNGRVELAPLRKIKNNECKKELSVEPTTVSCAQLSDPDQYKQEIMVSENEFLSRLLFYEYFDTVEDESLIMATEKDGVYISHDSGQNIRKFEVDDNIIEIVFNPFFNSSAYFFGESGSLYVTRDRGNSFYVTELPEARQLGFPLEFDAKDEETFIFYGGEDCDSIFDQNCHAVAYITNDGGETFSKLLDNAIHCEFAGSTFEYPVDEKLIICQIKEKQSQKRSLVSSKDFFQNDKTILFESIIGYMSTGDFLVVAIPYPNMELRAYVTVDGEEFAEAKFPQDYLSEKQESFTVLGSQTGAIFIHVSTSDRVGGEYGVLMKSNSNGTSFVALETAVNRNLYGMVDFEKVEGIEGIILINTVANAEKVSEGSEDKILKSKITFNDGSDWSYLRPPSKDSEGKAYPCGKQSLDKCSLHLHSYTEREDLRDTFSSGSAFGMLIGVGNVGEYLLPQEECSTFLSTDGGESWRELRKEPTQWEYGDHGGIIVLVSKNVPTDTITYSTNSGKTWADFKFTSEETIVKDIITVPRDSALRFLLITENSSIKGASTKTYSINFRNKFDGQCVFNPNDPDHDDFEYFPLSATESQCLFGHQAKYLKKIKDSCFVGSIPLGEFFKITKNCSCTRQDFECDYNYYKSSDGTCKLVNGLSPVDPTDICEKEKGLVEYFKPSGYRKIPLSTCVGGKNLDEASDPYPCPGMEKEFNEKYGLVGRSFILIFLILFVCFVLVAWFVYERGIRRNGGFSRFGEIRLNENELIEDNSTDRVVNGIVKSGLFAVSGVFAAYQLLKRSFSNVISSIGGRLRGRRGPSYSSLVHDQFLDEADDLLAGHDEDANDLGDFMENEGNFEIEDEAPSSVPDQIDRQTPEEISPDDDHIGN